VLLGEPFSLQAGAEGSALRQDGDGDSAIGGGAGRDGAADWAAALEGGYWADAANGYAIGLLCKPHHFLLRFELLDTCCTISCSHKDRNADQSLLLRNRT
jgi:hypothetical protein